MDSLNEAIVADAKRRLEELDRFYDAYFGDQLWTWDDVNAENPGDWDLYCELNEIVESAD